MKINNINKKINNNNNDINKNKLIILIIKIWI